MSGIVGYSGGSGTKAELCKSLSMLNVSDSVSIDPIYEDALIGCGKTHLSIFGETKSPIRLGKSSIWIIGEFYNIEFLRKVFKLRGESEGELLLEAYDSTQLESVLASVDGYFCAVLYDQQKKLVHFITDRLGIQPMYVWAKNNKLIWSTSLRCLLSFKRFHPELVESSIRQFLSHGYILGRNTWFEGVESLPASAWFSYSLVTLKKVQELRYWSWKSIRKTSIPFNTASEEIARLLRKAVRVRLSKDEQIQKSLSLSGGMDSRAILASSMYQAKVRTYTFGSKYCDDFKLARKVAGKAGVKHHLFELAHKNWWNHRVEELWQVDGSVSLLHLHAGQFHQKIRRLGLICLNGFAGDLILGGSFLKALGQNNRDESQLRLSSLYPGIDPSDPFLDLNNQDSFHIDCRVRRFTAFGLTGTNQFKYRMPLVDNLLMEFIYSLPDEYRWQQKIYKHLLLQNFPELFRKTRTTGTLRPISSGDYLYLSDFITRSINRVQRKIGRCVSVFADYDDWIQKDFYFLKGILEQRENILSQVLGEKKLTYRNGSTLNYKLFMRLVSMEIWFQQVFHGKYLTTEETLLQ